jgi:hypothetical protein
LAADEFGEDIGMPYPPVTDLLQPLGRVRMLRALRLYAPGGTFQVVARCNKREFSFTPYEPYPLAR